MAKEIKMVQCEHCGAQIAAGAKTCPQCGGKHKQPVYKRGWFIALMVVLVLAVFGAMGGEEDTLPEGHAEQSGGEPPVEITYTPYDVTELDKDLDSNALKAAGKYDEQYVELTGKLNVIDSSGSYISIVDATDRFAILGVQCYIQNEEQKEAVMDLEVGDILVVKGKITDVGEVMGYSLDIHALEKKN